jgi:hypothetical protein
MSLGQRYIGIDLMATDEFKIFSERAALTASGTAKGLVPGMIVRPALSGDAA